MAPNSREGDKEDQLIPTFLNWQTYNQLNKNQIAPDSREGDKEDQLIPAFLNWQTYNQLNKK